MNKMSLLKRAAAAAALSASAAAGIGVVGVMAAGTANARPIESMNCRGLYQTMESSFDMMIATYGNDQETFDYYERLYNQASTNHDRHCT